MKRRWQIEEPAAEPTEEQRHHLGRVLCNVPVTDQAELVALCSPAKGALGITKTTPNGRLGRGWFWAARHGYGVRLDDGLISESVALKLQNSTRGALFLWVRPAPSVAVLLAAVVPPVTLGRGGPRHADGMAPLWWPSLTAVVDALPKPEWKSTFTGAWTLNQDGRPDDLPRAMPSAAVKREVHTDEEICPPESGPVGDVPVREAVVSDQEGGQAGAPGTGPGRPGDGADGDGADRRVPVRDRMALRAPGGDQGKPERSAPEVPSGDGVTAVPTDREPAADVSRETPIDWDRVDADRYARAELYKRDATDLADKIMELHAELEATKRALGDAFVPVNLRWSLVKTGDAILAKDGAILPVLGTERVPDPDVPGGSIWRIQVPGRWLEWRHPGKPVPVLVRQREAFALKLLRGELNITVMDREGGA
jgi:hypothetical protein